MELLGLVGQELVFSLVLVMESLIATDYGLLLVQILIT